MFESQTEKFQNEVKEKTQKIIDGAVDNKTYLAKYKVTFTCVADSGIKLSEMDDYSKNRIAETLKSKTDEMGNILDDISTSLQNDSNSFGICGMDLEISPYGCIPDFMDGLKAIRDAVKNL